MDEITYQLLGWGFLFAAALTPVLIIIRSMEGYRLVKQEIETFRFKAVAAIFIWLCLTMAMLLILGFIAYVTSHAMSIEPSLKPHPTLDYVGLHSAYFSVCYLLVSWVSPRKSRKAL
ncbi:MAG TPA: hypothetical protein VGO91_05320 [Pyrinomonadaceae bacterium]|jgi:hypothetical protein|nr:hypothetical protein [Pyrinomonadaceae bacterium]